MNSCHTVEAHERMASKFRYPRLKTARSIRVLEVCAPTRRRVLNYRFIDLKLDEAKNQYTAVSYTWGDSALIACISLNSRDFPVRKNIFEFLLQLNRARWVGRLWVDAICINQKDTNEKSAQVSMMGSIFTFAKEVKAWLGLGTAETDQTFDFLNSRCVHGFNSGSESRSISANYFAGLSEIVGRPYWSRLWIVQEFCLATIVLLHCGSKSVPVKFGRDYNKTFSDMVLGLSVDNVGYVSADIILELMFGDIGVGLTRNFGRIIKDTSSMCCQEKHDRIYALMAVDQRRPPVATWTCDYDVSLLDLLQRVGNQCSPNHGLVAVLVLLYWWKLPPQAPEYQSVNIKVTLNFEMVRKVLDSSTGTFTSHLPEANHLFERSALRLCINGYIILVRPPPVNDGRTTLHIPEANDSSSDVFWISNVAYRFHLIDLRQHVLFDPFGNVPGGIVVIVKGGIGNTTDRTVKFTDLTFCCCVNMDITKGHSALWPLKDVFAKHFATARFARNDLEHLEIDLPIESWIHLVRDLQVVASEIQKQRLKSPELPLEFKKGEDDPPREGTSASEGGEITDEEMGS